MHYDEISTSANSVYISVTKRLASCTQGVLDCNSLSNSSRSEYLAANQAACLEPFRSVRFIQ